MCMKTRATWVPRKYSIRTPMMRFGCDACRQHAFVSCQLISRCSFQLKRSFSFDFSVHFMASDVRRAPSYRRLLFCWFSYSYRLFCSSKTLKFDIREFWSSVGCFLIFELTFFEQKIEWRKKQDKKTTHFSGDGAKVASNCLPFFMKNTWFAFCAPQMQFDFCFCLLVARELHRNGLESRWFAKYDNHTKAEQSLRAEQKKEHKFHSFSALFSVVQRHCHYKEKSREVKRNWRLENTRDSRQECRKRNKILHKTSVAIYGE